MVSPPAEQVDCRHDSRSKPFGLELNYLDQGTRLQDKASLPGLLEGALLLE